MHIAYNQILHIVNESREADVANWDLPMGLSLRLAGIMEKLEHEKGVFHKEWYKLLQKVCELDENGQVQVDDEGKAKIVDQETFKQEYLDMLQQEVELPITPLKIDFDELDKRVNKKPKEVAFLLPLLEQDGG